jgi:hypothetical protein
MRQWPTGVAVATTLLVILAMVHGELIHFCFLDPPIISAAMAQNTVQFLE